MQFVKFEGFTPVDKGCLDKIRMIILVYQAKINLESRVVRSKGILATPN